MSICLNAMTAFFDRYRNTLMAEDTEWLQPWRSHHFDCFKQIGLPGRKTDAWRYAPITPQLADKPFYVSPSVPRLDDAQRKAIDEQIRSLRQTAHAAGLTPFICVFVNGRVLSPSTYWRQTGDAGVEVRLEVIPGAA